MKVKVYSNSEGVICWHPSWPVEPKRDYRHGASTEFVFKLEWEAYVLEIESAKREAVPVEDRDAVLRLCYHASGEPRSFDWWKKVKLSPDTFYEFDFEGSVNIEDVFSHCTPGKKHYNRVARLIPAKQEEPKQHDSFSMWMDVCVFTHAIEAEGITKVINRLQKQFTITRKP